MGTQTAPSYANIFMDRKPDGLSQWNKLFPSYHQVHHRVVPGVHHVPGYESIYDRNRLVTDIYTKSTATDQYMYLHRRSCHPFHCEKGIAFIQALRLHRIRCRPQDYEQQVGELITYLVERGYKKEEVLHQINKASKGGPAKTTN